MLMNDKLLFARKKKGLSVEDFAALLNVEKSEVEGWESGNNVPDIGKLVEISNILDISIDYLVKDTNSINENSFKTSDALMPRRLKRKNRIFLEILIIIGGIVSPLVYFFPLYYNVGNYAFWSFSAYVYTIPLCFGACRCIRNASKKSELIGWGIVSMLFLSGFGGLFMILTLNIDFEDYNSRVNKESKKKIDKRKNSEDNNSKKIIDEKNNDNDFIKPLNKYSEKCVKLVDYYILKFQNKRCISQHKKEYMLKQLEVLKNEAQNVTNESELTTFNEEFNEIIHNQ